jgi:cytoskeletal protein CcmA (bactofilin family)
MKRIGFIAFLSILLCGSWLAGEEVFSKRAQFGSEVVIEGEPIENDYFSAGGSVKVGSPVEGDLFVAGGSITVEGPVGGDLFACGGNIVVEGHTRGDLFACGGSIHSIGNVEEDVRLFGGEILIDGSVGRNGSAFGGEVVVKEGGEIGRDLKVECGELEFSGTIKRNLEGSAEKIVISGRIDGDVNIEAREIHIMPSAQILGNFDYSSHEEAEIDEGALIQGAINHQLKKTKSKEKSGMGSFSILIKLISLGALILIGILRILVSPKQVDHFAGYILRTPWKSLGQGILIIIAFPVVVGVLAMTIIGIPIAFFATMLYLFLLYTSKLYTGLLIGQLILKGVGREEKGRMIGALVLGLIILVILTSIPYVGIIFLILAILLGLGAILSERIYLYRAGKEKGIV